MTLRLTSRALATVFTSLVALGIFGVSKAAELNDARIDLDQLEGRIDGLKKKETSLESAVQSSKNEREQLRRRIVARGRAYYRLARKDPSGDFFEHAVRVERLRQGLLSDQARFSELERSKKSMESELEIVRERRAPLEAERVAAGRARDALLAQSERERAFDLAFSGTSARLDHTAVYSSGSAMDFAGETFGQMKGRLPFPLSGRSEIETVKKPSASGLGLRLRSSVGTPVRAVFNARVVFAEEYTDYGKTVILDHGEGFFTVTAGLGSIDVEVGDAVTAGSRVGMLGGLGALGEVYFEVRHQREVLAPGEWFGI